MKAMILAAGLGTRMRPLTDHTPKPLLLIKGKPLISYHLEKLAAVGITCVVINHAYLGEQIEQFVGDGSRWGLSVFFSKEIQPLETGGGICQALPLLGQDPFLVINSDVWCDYKLEQLLELSMPGLAHLLFVPNPKHHLNGDFAIASDGWAEEKKEGHESFTFSGISVLRPQLFANRLPGKFPLAPLLLEAIRKHQVTAETYDGYWLDIGTPDRLKELEDRVELLFGSH